MDVYMWDIYGHIHTCEREDGMSQGAVRRLPNNFVIQREAEHRQVGARHVLYGEESFVASAFC